MGEFLFISYYYPVILIVISTIQNGYKASLNGLCQLWICGSIAASSVWILCSEVLSNPSVIIVIIIIVIQLVKELKKNTSKISNISTIIIIVSSAVTFKNVADQIYS